MTCCSDNHCATHAEVREQAHWKEQVLAGTAPIQILANEKRLKAITPGRFKEGNFSYLGDTVVAWDLKQYFSNPAWRDDAIRKSKKRKTRQWNHDLSATTITTTTMTSRATANAGRKGRRRRFEDAMEDLYTKSLVS